MMEVLYLGKKSIKSIKDGEVFSSITVLLAALTETQTNHNFITF